MCFCQFFPVQRDFFKKSRETFFIMDYKIDHDEVTLMYNLVFLEFKFL